MDYKKILEDLSKNVNFSKYDAFSKEKKCHYIKYDGVDYAFIWQTVNPNDMKDTMGLPTMKPMSLSTLTGYCQCANAHVEADLPAPILNEIDAYLNSGFFIE